MQIITKNINRNQKCTVIITRFITDRWACMAKLLDFYVVTAVESTSKK